MSLTFQPETERQIEAQMKTSGYSSPDELIKAALELLKREEQGRTRDLDDLRKMIAVGVDQLDRGEGTDGEQTFDDLLADLDDDARGAK
jgi:antitoxin ParD1/3/4